MKRLLKTRTWLLFVFILAPGLLPDTNTILQLARQTGMAIYITWLFAIGSTMWVSFNNRVKPDIILFKISCLLLLSTLIAYTLADPFEKFVDQPWFWWAIIFLISVNFYILVFAARMLESAVQGRKVGFSDSFKVFLALWFFPIGIWYIQPMIRKVLNGQTAEISRQVE